MATRYYIVGGAYYTWDQLHNQFGYTDHETANISYKSAHPTTWGESAGSGYFDGDQTDMVNGSFWSDEDTTAWHTLNSLALDVEVYPADATDCAMEKDGVRSDAVSIESDGVTYYLIRNVWDSGWMSESEAAAEGWEPAQPGPVLPVVYTHTGTQTAASIAPDASFDTGLTYDSNNLYIGETDDGLGDVTRYGWEAEEGPEPPAYTEITLYMQSGNKQAQSGVTSSFAGNVNSTYCYPLYTDVECITRWSGYDYSNDYELGRYVDGVWTPYIRQNVANMPATTTGNNDYVFGRILLDTGELWHVTNYQVVGTTSNLNPIIRIYPKAQQHYAFYNTSTYLHRNASLSSGSIDGLVGARGISSAQTVPWGVQDSTLPVRTIVKILGAAGNELSLTGLDWRDPSLGYKFYQLANGSGSSISYRSVIFTLSKPTETGYTNLAGSNDSVGTSAVPLYKKTGEKVDYDPAYSYRVIGIFKANGDAANGLWSNVNNLVLEDDGYGKMTVKRSSGSAISLNKVWYIKEVINPIETTFGAAVTIPAGYEVESVTCSRGYAFAANVVSSGTIVDYEIPGEKIYFDSTNTALVGVGVKPALQIAAIRDLSQGKSAVLSCNSGYSGTRPTSASASYVNSDGYTVKGTANFSNSSIGSTVASNMQTFPVYFNLCDSSESWLYFCFRVPQTLWQFQNGVFSWLGDTTDSSDLAYWYNGRAVQINLRPITM